MQNVTNDNFADVPDGTRDPYDDVLSARLCTQRISFLIANTKTAALQNADRGDRFLDRAKIDDAAVSPHRIDECDDLSDVSLIGRFDTQARIRLLDLCRDGFPQLAQLRPKRPKAAA